ncbi:hypothetical protein HHL22_10820 [Hymenobacter sp. RP-2-7]|uniref:STAS/SEC14 domain-containing protein n=1 Tax=Hymenobacter polaris TaxID=2682546 RepID=A0A7Y0FMD0_9BACT|nr:hypothetical protein [Hymenobacter polaris]NML65697.1 hypothetical protein [Hymenobacter polaris]
MIFKHLSPLFIQEDAELQLLRVRWAGSRNAPAFRTAASGLVDLMQQHGTRRLLLELSEQPDLPVYDQLWLSTTLLPRIAQLPVTQLVIILASQRVYNRHVLESLLMQYQARIKADVQFFTQDEAALDWLTDNSPRVPALLAEWARETHPSSNQATSRLLC